MALSRRLWILAVQGSVFNRREEGVVDGDEGVVVEDAALSASEMPVIEEERWGADDEEKFLSYLEKLSGFGTGMIRDGIKATAELKKLTL
ncbi:hypothetical protein BGX30_010195 [Mortierella sp. GBA39]|nr:hypothetical protein BGX30_010195 [Mortierella sp. GBA39]